MQNRKLKICIVQPDHYSPQMPARPAVTEIYGNCLPSFGHQIIWISPFGKDINEINKIKYNNIDIYLVPYHMVSNLLGKLACFIKFYFREYRLLMQIVKNEKYEIVQVRNDVFASLVALHITKKSNIPFVFQYSFPIEAFKSQKSEKKYLYYFNQVRFYILNYVLKKADFIFPISKWMEAKLVNEGISKSKMMPLPMGVSPELFDLNINGSNIRSKYLLNDSKLLLYIGSMDKLRALESIIHAFCYVHKEYENIKMLMVGDGNDRKHLETISRDLGLQQNIIFTGQIPYFDVPAYISAADICLSPIRPLDIYKVSSPTKLFESMVMCKPVVANKGIPEQKEVIEQSGGGILVDFKPESFANGIIELLQNPETAKEMGENGYKWVIENRSYESMAHDVETQFYKLLESSGDLQQ